MCIYIEGGALTDYRARLYIASNYNIGIGVHTHTHHPHAHTHITHAPVAGVARPVLVLWATAPSPYPVDVLVTLGGVFSKVDTCSTECMEG